MAELLPAFARLKRGQEKSSVTSPPPTRDTYPRDNCAIECSLKFPRWIRAYLPSRRLYTLYSAPANDASLRLSSPPLLFPHSTSHSPRRSRPAVVLRRISEYRRCYYARVGLSSPCPAEYRSAYVVTAHPRAAGPGFRKILRTTRRELLEEISRTKVRCHDATERNARRNGDLRVVSSDCVYALCASIRIVRT